nr:amidohydrolase family protein [Candidatus Sigynarchaeota archaeon]
MATIIDAHVHTNFADTPLVTIAKENGIRFSLEGLVDEMAKAHVDRAISIRSDLSAIECRAKNTSGCAPPDKPLPENITDVAYINPLLDQQWQLQAMETLLQKRQIGGIKIYLGYYHEFPSSPVYTPFYELAAKHKVPIIFHTGDTFSAIAKLKYSQPLLVDEVAVDFSHTTFVIAHFGYPAWVFDAAEVVDKNENVYADLSGWVEGLPTGAVAVAQVKEAMATCNYARLMYGSDWPLVPMQTYVALVRKLVPKEHHESIFSRTAREVFHLPL